MELVVNGARVLAATGGRPFDPARPVIVFLHGAGLDHSCWQLESRWFAWHGWSVLAVDLPAHGRSEGAPIASIPDFVDWMLALLDAAKVERAALVGHSMGAVIALETAAREPDRVTGLGLLGVSSSMPVHPSLLGAAREAPGRAYDMMTGWCFANGAKLGRSAAPGLWMTGGARALLARGRDGALAADLGACAEWKTGPAAAKAVACPTLVVLGAEDVMTPARRGRELAALVAGAKVETIAGCGHMMMQEAPDATLGALIAHFGAK